MSDKGPNAALIGLPGSRNRLMTPVLLIDLDAMERNIARMADYCRDRGVPLRPLHHREKIYADGGHERSI